MKDGRPLRFLGGTFGGWTLFRVAALWPSAETLPLRALAQAIVPPVLALAMPKPAPVPVARLMTMVRQAPVIAVVAAAEPGVLRATAIPPPNAVDQPAAPLRLQGVIGPPLRPAPIAHGPGRLAGSAWTLVRGGPSGTLSGGQLGASQAGSG